MKRTAFHRKIISLLADRMIDGGLRELSWMTGIKYRTLWGRTRTPRTMPLYEFFSIAEALHLNQEEEAGLLTAIREG